MRIRLSKPCLLKWLFRNLSFFKQQSGSAKAQKTLLDKKTLLALRQQAEQINCSASPQHSLESRQSGNLPSRAIGSGMDYAESRVYQAGDDTRSINWRLTARSNETFVKTYRVESRPNMSLILDRRRTMLFGTRKQLKITQAVRVACLLSYAAEFHQLGFQAWIIDDNGFYFFDNHDAFLDQANKPCVMSITDDTAGIVSIGALIQEVTMRLIKGASQEQGSLVYFLSDFIDLKKTHRADLANLNDQCFIQAIDIMDKAEFELPQVGKIKLQNMQNDSNEPFNTYPLNTNKAKDREVFMQLSRQFFEGKKSIFDSVGINYTPLATDVEKILDYISLPLGRA